MVLPASGQSYGFDLIQSLGQFSGVQYLLALMLAAALQQGSEFREVVDRQVEAMDA